MTPNVLFFGTNNAHKLDEIRQLVGNLYTVRSFQDLSSPLEVEETERTLEGNALLKARAFFAHTGTPCFADDTGLEVEALGGAPGVYSARYAGEGATFADNMNKLLRDLEAVDMGAWGEDNRRARFRTVIAYVDGGEPRFFEGVVRGTLTLAPAGNGGFGYDPIFMPDGHSVTFSEMTPEAKNAISHRGKAVMAFATWLQHKAHEEASV